MNTEELKNLFIESAQNYYNYLVDNNKGVDSQQIQTKIKTIDIENQIYQIQLSKRVYDINVVYFEFRHRSNPQNTNKFLIYTRDEIEIIEYDSDNKTINIKIKNSAVDIQEINKYIKTFYVISDLRFLVKNIITWYERNWNLLIIPAHLNSNTESYREINIKAPELDEPQRSAVKTVLTNQFVYVWGPPGTGKTQKVLLNCMIDYIQKDKKIGIFAPTNNSLEQILSSLIPITDKLNIPREKIIRIGTPTAEFAAKFPEVCEVQGINRKIQEINKQIKIIENIIKYRELKSKYENFYSKIHIDIEKLNDLQTTKTRIQYLIESKKKKINLTEAEKNKEANKLIKNKREYKELTLYLESYISDIDRFNQYINEIKNEREKIINKILAFIKINRFERELKNYSDSIQSIETKINDINNRITILQKEIYESSPLINEYEITITALKNELTANENELSVIITQTDKIEQTIAENFKKNNYNKDFNINNIEDEYNKHNQVLKEYSTLNNSYSDSYKNMNINDLQKLLNSYTEEKKRLEQNSLNSRLQNFNIIGVTLDSYIGRFYDNILYLDHCFLDEAGYAPMIKAFVLFACGCPVTLLGDHLQLQPICELYAKDLEKIEYKNIKPFAFPSIYLDYSFKKKETDLLKLPVEAEPPFLEYTMRKAILKKTYRFGPGLCRILENFIYKIGFESALTADNDIKIEYIDARQLTPPENKHENPAECAAILKLIETLNDSENYMILTPYKKQHTFINKRLPQKLKYDYVLTTHRAQGREWDTVIFSAVDSGYIQMNKPYFTDTNNFIGRVVLNTTLSRAKKKLIIVCDGKYWKNERRQMLNELI